MWITTNQFAIASDGSYNYVGMGVWGMSKASLLAGAASVPNFAWFLPFEATLSFTMQPAKASEAGTMHFVSAFSVDYLQVSGEEEEEHAGARHTPPPPLRRQTGRWGCGRSRARPTSARVHARCALSLSLSLPPAISHASPRGPHPPLPSPTHSTYPPPARTA